MHGSFEGKKTQQKTIFTTETVGLILSGSDLLFEAQGHINSLASALHAQREAAGERDRRGEERMQEMFLWYMSI